MVLGDMFASFSIQNPYQNPIENQCLFYLRNQRTIMQKSAQNRRILGSQRPPKHEAKTKTIF